MYFSRQFIVSLKQSISIEKLIGQYVDLKKHGDHLIGQCPFHKEHNPSFTVFPQTQSFYCFGCHAGSKAVSSSSDHIAFLMAYFKLSFPQAIERLAEITQTPLPNQKESQSRETAKSQVADLKVQQNKTHKQPSEDCDPPMPKVEKDLICQQIFNFAARFYHQQLFQVENKFALDYLTKQRNRNPEIIKQFQIGFAKGGRTLYQFLRNKGFSDDQLLRSNLIAKRGNRILDYFFGEIIIFPHFKNNNVIGFTIKDLGRYKSEIKLRLFSRNYFYNNDALKSNEIILVEGESDLHSIVQFTDHKNVLALCGNQLTQHGLQKLRQANISKIYLALDRDAAGRKATSTISKKLTDAGITVCQLQWRCHKDVDLWLKLMPPAERKDSFGKLISEANEKITSIRQTKNSGQQNKSDSKKNEAPSNLQLIKELIKAVSILLATILIILKSSKSYIKHRKNPQLKKSSYHPRPTFSVDKLPIYVPKGNVPHYTILLKQFQKEHGKPLKPVNRRNNKRKPYKDAHCQFCGAPVDYLSLNDGKKQVWCKVCKHLSNPDKIIKDVAIRCPHCNKTLEKMKKDTEKNGYLYYKCRNKNCSYFITNKTRHKNLSKKKQKNNLKKLHYIYRKPVFDITSLHPNSPDKPKTDLANVRASAHVIGLVLTYRACGMSTRFIETVMQEIHAVSICHQTVKNYLDAAAYRLAPMVMNYPYKLSQTLTADETYVRMMAKWSYLTWSLDPKMQIITALNVSEKRNLVELAKAINHAVSKFSLDMLAENADYNPLLVTDGNPVYKLIVQFLRQANIFINHKVVIGLENKDDQSTDFRNLKQIIERLNKNFKKYINNSEHFGSTNGVLSAAIIFTAHFNFIRKNRVLNGNIPVPIETINPPAGGQNQPFRWVRLLESAQNFALQSQ